MTHEEIGQLIKDATAHYQQMADHQRVRKTGYLMIALLAVAKSYHYAYESLHQQSELLRKETFPPVGTEFFTGTAEEGKKIINEKIIGDGLDSGGKRC